MTRHTIFAAFASAALLAGPALAADNPIVGAPSPVPHPVANYLPITIDKKARRRALRMHALPCGKLSGEASRPCERKRRHGRLTSP